MEPAAQHICPTHPPRLRSRLLLCRDSYNTSNTKKHDEVAMRYLSYALYPLVGGYAIYSLLYKSHKSWWVGLGAEGCGPLGAWASMGVMWSAMCWAGAHWAIGPWGCAMLGGAGGMDGSMKGA